MYSDMLGLLCSTGSEENITYVALVQCGFSIGLPAACSNAHQCLLVIHLQSYMRSEIGDIGKLGGLLRSCPMEA